MRVAALSTAAVALCGCTLLFPLEERSDAGGGGATTSATGGATAGTGPGTTGPGAGGPGAGGETSAGGQGPGGAGGSGAGGGGGLPCDPDPDLESDPDHCGACGRTCGRTPEGGAVACEGGLCVPSPLGSFAGDEVVFDLVAFGRGEDLVLHASATNTALHRLVEIRLTPNGEEPSETLVSRAGLRLAGLTRSSKGTAMAVADTKAADRFFLTEAPDEVRPLTVAPVHHTTFVQVLQFDVIVRADHGGGRLLLAVRDSSTEDPFDEGGFAPITGPELESAWDLLGIDSRLYVTQLRQGGGLRSWDLTQGTTTVFQAEGSAVVAVAADEEHLYWADCTGARIYRAPRADPYETSAWDSFATERHPTALAVDPGSGGEVFWAEVADPAACTELDAIGSGRSRILSAPKDASGAPFALAEDGAHVLRLVAPGGEPHLYWAAFSSRAGGSGVRRVHR